MPFNGVRSSCEVLARNSLLSREASSSWAFISSSRRFESSSSWLEWRMRRSASTRSRTSRTIAVYTSSSPSSERPIENSTGMRSPSGRIASPVTTAPVCGSAVERPACPQCRSFLIGSSTITSAGCPTMASAARLTERTRPLLSNVKMASNAVSSMAWSRRAWRSVSSLSRLDIACAYERRHTSTIARKRKPRIRSTETSACRIDAMGASISARGAWATRPHSAFWSGRVTAHTRPPRSSGTSTRDATRVAAMAAAMASGAAIGMRVPGRVNVDVGGRDSSSTSLPCARTR